MTTEQQEDMEAALLAGMVKGKMKSIDSMMESRPDVPADRINLNSFVEKIQINRQNNIQNITSDQIIEQSIPTIHHIVPDNKNFTLDDNFKDDLNSIKANLEKINNNLTKLCGMFGKVFHNLTKNEKNG